MARLGTATVLSTASRPCGYISTSVGANITAAPAASATARSPARSHGVGVQVLPVSELERVDEDRHHDHVGVRGRGADQLGMAAVQRAHGRDEADPVTPRPLGVESVPQLDAPHDGGDHGRHAIPPGNS